MLGDFVADSIHLLTGLEPCGSCNERREWLNEFGGRLVSKLDLLRGGGKVDAMIYNVTVNTQKQYRVEANNEDDAKKGTTPENHTFTAETINVRLEQKAPAGPPTIPIGPSSP